MSKAKQENEEPEWWAIARTELVLGLLRKYAPIDKKISVLDVGCSDGRILSAIRENIGCSSVGIELDDALLQLAKNKGLHCIKGNAENFKLDKKFDVVLVLDVLEHLSNDEVALVNAVNHLTDGGIIVLSVPMFNLLWSQQDSRLRHLRRYEPRTIASLIDRAGLSVQFSSYWNSILFLPSALFKVLCKFLPIRSDNAALDILLGPVLLQVLRFENWLILNSVRLPIGISLFVVCKKK